MNTLQPDASKETLSPQRIQEKADILETNLFRSISKQTDPSEIHLKINRTSFPDPVISKALLQLMPRFNVKPRDFFLDLKNLLQREIPKDKPEKFEKLLDLENDTPDSETGLLRTFKAIASPGELEIIVRGIPEIKTRHGEIGKSFFNHEQSPGKMLKDGVINFREINKYPVVNAGDNLFYITHEAPGTPGISFEGAVIPVQEPKPYVINIGPGIKEIDDPGERGESKGYFLQALTTGVVILDRDEHQRIKGIDISEEIKIEKLDYSTGNIGTHYTCPIQMKIGVICSGFKLRVNGKVETTVVEGGEIITDSEAVITKAQSGSSIFASKDIRIDSATHSTLVSQTGTITVKRELIDSNLSSPRIVFEKNKGLITNNTMETENLTLTGLYFSGENIIRFGKTLFAEKEDLVKALENIRAEKLQFSNNQKLLMGQLQLELKRLAKLTLADNELIKHIRPIIMATATMDYETIYREMDLIEKKNNTRVVASVRKLFETLEKIPKSIEACSIKESTADADISRIDHRMSLMKLSIEGHLRRAATLKIFCGNIDDIKAVEPNFMIESDNVENKTVKVTGTFSFHKGFAFVH